MLEVYRNKIVQDAFPVVKYFYIRIPKIDRRLTNAGSVINPASSTTVGGGLEPAPAVKVVRQAVDRAEASREAFECRGKIRAFVAHNRIMTRTHYYNFCCSGAYDFEIL